MERFNLVNDAWALRARAEAGLRRVPGPRAEAPRGEGPERLEHHRRLAPCPPRITSGEHRSRVQEAHPRPGAGPCSRSSAGRRSRASPPPCASCAAPWRRCSAPSGRTRRCSRRQRGSSPRGRRDRGSVDPNVVPALVSTLAYTGNQRTLRRVPGAFPRRRHRPGEAAIPARPWRVPRAGAFHVGHRHGDERGEGGRRSATSSARTWASSKPDRRRGRPSARKLGKDREEVPRVGHGAHDRGVLRAGYARSLRRRSRGSLPARKWPQGEMPVAQMLERLSVNVRLRRTEGPRLEAYLRG